MHAVKHVHFFCSDMLPLEGVPTTGGGLRSWQFIQGLKSKGYEVTFSMPGVDTYLNKRFLDKIPEDIRSACWNFENQDTLVERFNPDAIFFANPDNNILQRDHGVPILCDMHGPRLIETELARGFFNVDDRIRDLKAQLSSFMKTDFFTCAGKNQRFYFVSFLLMAGYPVEDINIDVVPVSLSPETPSFDKDLDAKRFIYCGGFFPWQNPGVGLCALSEVLTEEKQGALTIYGGSHNFHERDKQLFAHLKDTLEQNPAVSFRGYVPRDGILEEYRSSYVAFEVMEKNLERELAFTTRTIEFLWAGLPVIYNNYAELSEYIRSYEAGWCVDPGNTEQIKSAVREALHEPERVVEYARNAQKLASEHFNWENTIAPVDAYLKNPVRRNHGGENDTKMVSFFSGDGSNEALARLQQIESCRSMRLARLISKIYSIPKKLAKSIKK